jgi:hypothetical protein
MKKSICCLAASFLFLCANAQLKTTPVCPPIVVDILYGKVNQLNSTSTIGQIKALFPCYTTIEEETAGTPCGGGIFYNDKDIYFYTGRDYVTIGEKFKGKLSIPLMGASRNNLFKWLGNPKIKDVNWDAFQMAYGTMILYYNKTGKINKIQFSTKSTETLNLCESGK